MSMKDIYLAEFISKHQDAFAALFEEQSLGLEGERLEQAARWGIPDVINQCCYGAWESARWIGPAKHPGF